MNVAGNVAVVACAGGFTLTLGGIRVGQVLPFKTAVKKARRQAAHQLACGGK